MKKSIALVAMCATALSPILSTAAYADELLEQPFADDANATTLAAMQAQCNLLIPSYAAGNQHRWSADVVVGDATLVSGPTETGNRVKDNSTIQHAGDYVPSKLEIRGDPYRNGGSVNMFGDQWTTAGYWTDSTYEFTADFASTFAHAFDCSIVWEEYHPAVFVPAVPVQGYYVVNPDAHGNEEAHQNSCNAFTAIGPTAPFWGQPQGQCVFVKTADAQDAYTIPAYYDPEEEFDLVPGTPVNQNQTDNLRAFEDHGGPVQVTGDMFLGKTVICISPSTNSKNTKADGWRNQNGYTGTKCTTDWFKVAPILNGSTTSQGTYNSVPNYYYP